MATLLELVREGKLIRVDPQLGRSKFEERCLYLLPQAKQWIEVTLPGLGSSWKIEVSPNEQLDALIFEFCSGEPLWVGKRFKCLTHLGDGIWQLKTADLRLFGWFLRRDNFIVSDCDSTDRIKKSNLYRGYCEQAVMRRDALNLDEPKFVSGDNPDDVVSNCC